LTRWWNDDSRVWAVVTGRISGIVILDFDGKAGPVDASKTPFLGPASEWPLEDRLATHQSWRVTPENSWQDGRKEHDA